MKLNRINFICIFLRVRNSKQGIFLLPFPLQNVRYQRFGGASCLQFQDGREKYSWERGKLKDEEHQVEGDILSRD
jgi:hypothetical protein